MIDTTVVVDALSDSLRSSLHPKLPGLMQVTDHDDFNVSGWQTGHDFVADKTVFAQCFSEQQPVLFD